MSSNELDSQLRAVGVNKEQRKRLIAAARLGGIPNPLKQLGLQEPASSAERRSRSRSSSRRAAVAWQAAALEAPPPPVAPGSASSTGSVPLVSAPGAVALGGAQRPARQPAVRLAVRSGGQGATNVKEEEDPDLDSFLAGGRAIMAKAKAMGQARREQAAKERVEVERQYQREQEEAVAVERARKEQERRREEEERERQEEEKRREARRRARKEEKMRRKEQKKKQRAEEEEELEEEDSMEDDHEDDEADHRRRQQQQAPSKGFFSQAFKGNQQQRALWSEPIKGHVSNNYKGTSDADLERRFRLIGAGAQPAGEKLMTEEEVLAMLRNRKSKGR